MNTKKRKLNIKIIFILVSICIVFGSTISAHGYYYDDDYPEIDSAYWDNRTARWTSYGYASRYEIVLYKDGYRVTTTTSTHESINLSQYISSRGGEYYFEVRPYNVRSGWGNWVSSDSVYMTGYYYDYDDRYYDRYYDDRYYYDNYPYNQDISYANNQGPPINSNQNIYNPNANSNIIMPGSGQSQSTYQYQVASENVQNKQSITVPTPQVVYQQANGQTSSGSFVEAYGLWHFIYQNGIPATNTWVQYMGKWYYIDMSGVMAVGLYTINGSTYYLQSDGSMAVGTHVLDGVTHFFDNNGVMVY